MWRNPIFSGVVCAMLAPVVLVIMLVFHRVPLAHWLDAWPIWIMAIVGSAILYPAARDGAEIENLKEKHRAPRR